MASVESNGEPDRISVVVSTRGRPLHAVECVTTILACRDLFELIVIDQSDDAATRDALVTHTSRTELRYIESASRGVSAGRNEGIAQSRGTVVVFIDDDCRVPSDWLVRLGALFAAEPRAAVVCGRVVMPEHDVTIGHAAVFEPRRRIYEGEFPPPGTDWGIGANFSARRWVFDRVGMFDTVLGAGAPLRAGEDLDMLVRVLQAGLMVVNGAEIEVVHLGVRRHGREARALWRAYGTGAGAALAKYVRLSDARAARLYLSWLRHILGRNVRSLLTRTRPTHLTFTLGFLQGSARSIRYRIDREDEVYIARGRSNHRPVSLSDVKPAETDR